MPQIQELAGEDPDQLVVAKQKKQAADQAFKSGNLKDALRSYHESLLYLNGLNKNAMQAAVPGTADPQSTEKVPKTEVDELLDKIYSNLSQCHIKQGNWKRAMETADKALSKNSKNTKALFRKAKSLGELGFFEKADKIFEDLLTKDLPESENVAIKAEQARLKIVDKEREKEHNKKLRGFLNRDRGEKEEE